MHKLFFAAALLLAPCGLAAPAAAQPSETGAKVLRVSAGTREQRITLGLNKAEVVELDRDVKDVDVAGPDIVDAVVKSPRRVLLIASKPGQTNIFFSDGEGRRLLSLDIRVEKDTTDLETLMRETLPNADIKVQAIADNVLLSGTVATAIEASRAVNLANGFAGDPKKVVNMLSVSGGQQVTLKVRVAEMSRTVAKQLGINISSVQFAGTAPIVLNSSNPYGLLGKALSDLSGAQFGQICANGSTTVNPLSALKGGGNCPINTDLQGTLNALEQVGLVHLLAEPNLTAVSGETANFLAGGEFPIPVARDRDGNITVDYKKFGVGLAFTPVVLSSGRISLQISTEVSELSTTGSYQIGTGANALTIPALAVRRAQTVVELPSGGTFAIAGLMQHNTKQVIAGVPGAKDLPVLGGLFRSRDFQNEETELVVLASVYLAEPNGAAAYTAPTEGFVVPTDPETILLGRLNATYKKTDAPVQSLAAAPVGFIVQ
jgi:pilus assembly protein CpaC